MDRGDMIARGERVKALLSNQDLIDAFLGVRASCLENASRATGPDDAWVAVAHIQAVDRIWACLQAFWKNGEGAMQDLLAEQANLADSSRDSQETAARLRRARDARREWAELSDYSQWNWKREEQTP